ncbi:serine/threonine-protein kinase [Amycolatopsis nigrescens]|uniref:serine/threonine-protein kinase n=1 Tax=Amycolatopsis nigrescens TaxID=381445 RepID=UPI0003AA89D7|nr:serine/threonine-protein kinase [Amycolatopsis nigrescens]
MDDWSLPGFTELQPLGSGTFGRVVLARHEHSGTVVAIKYLFARYLADPVQLASFRREARLLHQLSSPHIARLYEFVEQAEGAAIVMEAVPGVSLRELLLADGTLTPESALAVLKGSLLGLAGAHAAGTVHRDYKPDNVLIGPDRQSKLVDFGIAVLAGEAGLPVGTPAYMAPEQWQGGPATPATDVYAATCVFFQCVTGRRPYVADDTQALRRLHEHAPVPLTEAPEPVRELVARGMAKSVAGRPSGAAELIAELERTAVAGYGADWEERGRSRLAQRAAALFALSPLAALGAVGTAAAPGAATVAAAHGGGVAAGVGAGGIAAGGKIAAIVASVVAAVAVSAIVVVVNENDDTPPQAAPPVVAQDALQVGLANRVERFTGPGFQVDAQYVRVSGLTDQARADRINAELMAPIDARIEAVRKALVSYGEDRPGTRTTTKAEVLLAGPKLISVRYKHGTEGEVLGHSTWFSTETRTVDAVSGRLLGPEEVFRPEIRTADGMKVLVERLRASSPDGFCGEQDRVRYPLDPGLLKYQYGDTPISIAFGREAAEFAVFLPSLGLYDNACGEQNYRLDYPQLTDLLSPDFAALLVPS